MKNLKTILMVVAAVLIGLLGYWILKRIVAFIILAVCVAGAYIFINSFMKKKEVKKAEESQKGDN